jgi:hypothetical protein
MLLVPMGFIFVSSFSLYNSLILFFAQCYGPTPF